MSGRFCQVALPVPLRAAFTYAVPASMQGEPLAGRRVVVPFGRRAMIGVILAESDRPPDLESLKTSLKEIAQLMDPQPALPPRLLELGHWISRYYLAPVGETFRAMLPPEIELRSDREFRLTDSGRFYLDELAKAEETTDTERAELALLEHLNRKGSPWAPARLRGQPRAEAEAEKLVRRGYLEAREMVRRRATRVQKIVAWNPSSAEPLAGSPAERVREILTATRGPLPVAVLRQQAKVTRAVLDRLEKEAFLTAWEEPLTPGDDPWETDFTPPANLLNAEQRQALEEVSRWLAAGEFAAALLHGVTGSGKTEV